ncbi:unnamed protein product [Protopolystoma xenopodis]|uniref:Uncharacterized protein n=1 Tax=Protopolystoma xenopodis TaxID=117903 RepID=A0A3S5CLU5_9PLAT|nr:unnamed protein product [Protopolystoma xenopodis]
MNGLAVSNYMNSAAVAASLLGLTGNAGPPGGQTATAISGIAAPTAYSEPHQHQPNVQPHHAHHHQQQHQQQPQQQAQPHHHRQQQQQQQAFATLAAVASMLPNSSLNGLTGQSSPGSYGTSYNLGSLPTGSAGLYDYATGLGLSAEQLALLISTYGLAGSATAAPTAAQAPASLTGLNGHLGLSGHPGHPGSAQVHQHQQHVHNQSTTGRHFVSGGYPGLTTNTPPFALQVRNHF